MKTKVVLVEDSPILARTVSKIISQERDFQLLGVCSGELEFQELVRNSRPDVALIDLNLSRSKSGMDLLKWLAKEHPGVRSVVLTANEEVSTMLDCFVLGARGYVLKSQIRFLAQSIIEVLDGLYVIPHALSENLVKEAVEMRRKWQRIKAWDGFTSRERELLALLEAGLSRIEAAIRLGISFFTVRRHIQKILQKSDMPTIRRLLETS